MFAEQPAMSIFDSECSVVQAAEHDRSIVHIPDPIVDFLRTDVLCDDSRADAYPSRVPADSPVAAYVSGLEVGRVLELWKSFRIWSRRTLVDGCGSPLTESLVRSFEVELLPESNEATLLGTEVRGRGRVVSALRVLCIRSCRPFCSG